MSKDTEKKPTWNPEARAAALRAAAQKPESRGEAILAWIKEHPLEIDEGDLEAFRDARREQDW